MALAIPLFSGDKSTFPAWRTALLDVASASSVICPSGHGLMGFCVQPAEWATLTPPPGFPDPEGDAFTPAPHPGPPPGTATAFPLWKHNADRHTQQQAEVKAFKDKVYMALDPVSRAAVSDPLHGIRNRRLTDILASLDLQHGILSPADLARSLDSLKIPFVPGSVSLRDFVNAHRRVHQEALRNGQQIAEFSRVRELIAALGPCGVFSTRIALWRIHLPSAAQQTFELLAAAVVEFDDNRDSTATSATGGYSPSVQPIALAATATPLPSALLEFIEAAVAAAVSGRKRTPSQTSGPSPPPGGSLYCWTHGPGGHKGTECRNPAPGHVSTATATSMHGGRSKTRVHKKA
jgi:hypothetical protein